MADIPLQTRNRALYESLAVLSTQVLALSRQRIVDKPQSIPFVRQLRWCKEERGDTFARRALDLPEYGFFFSQLGPAIEQLATFAPAVAALKADQVWGAQVDKLVGTSRMRMLRPLHQTIVGPAVRTLHRNADPALDQVSIDEEIERLERFFAAEHFAYVAVAPVYGVRIGESLVLEPGVSIEPLTDDVLLRLLNFGIISSTNLLSPGDLVMQPPRAVVLVQRHLQKQVGPGATMSPEDTAIDATNAEKLNQAVDLLSLAVGAAVVCPGVLTETRGLLVEGGGIDRRTQPVNELMPSPVLTADQCQEIVEWWRLIGGHSKKSRQFLSIALRRLSMGLNRTLVDDKIIDMMICAEALFLSNENSGEITYKLSHRAALLLAQGKEEREQVFEFFKEAYALRSKVVHGSKSPATDQKEAAKAAATAERLGTLLQQALREILKIAADPNAPAAIEWKGRMFA